MNSVTGTVPSEPPTPRFRDSAGADWAAALLAYGVWGFFPLYWRLFAGIPAFEIVLQRTVWSAAVLAAVIAVVRRENVFRQFAGAWTKRKILAPAALLIGANWLVYVWAVGNGRVLEASLGYFVCPFIQILLGALLHGERVSRPVAAAIGVSLLGVAWIAVASGVAEFPWVALTLATSFAFYGSLKKNAGIAPVQGAFFESAVLALPALAYVLVRAETGTAAPEFYGETRFWVLSAIGGALTAFPLILYSAAAKRLPLASLGFLQFINPTLQFALAITVFGERLEPAKAGGFALIWAGVALYLATKLRPARQSIGASGGRGRAAGPESASPGMKTAS